MARARDRGRCDPGDEHGRVLPRLPRHPGRLRVRLPALDLDSRYGGGLRPGRGRGGAPAHPILDPVEGAGRGGGGQLPQLGRPLYPGLSIPAPGLPRTLWYDNIRRLCDISRTGHGPWGRHQLLSQGAEPHRAVSGATGVCGAGRQLSGRLRLRARVPGSGRGGLGQRTGPRRGRRRRFPQGAAMVQREDRHLRVQLRGHSEHGGHRPRARRLRRRRAHGGDLRLCRRLRQRGPAGKDLHQDRTRGRTRGAARRLRRQQYAGARARHRHANPDHARRGGRTRPVPPVRAGRGDPGEGRQDLREPLLSRRTARIPRSDEPGGHVPAPGGVVRAMAEGGCRRPGLAGRGMAGLQPRGGGA